VGRALRALRAGVLVFHGVKTAGLLANAVVFPRLAPAPADGLPAVSLLVPARDEAPNLVRTLPTWLDQPVLEVLVLDDGSTDGTPDLVHELAAGEPRVRVLEGRPLPAGWLGKPWACHQLAEAARGELLVFCDADVELHPGAVSAIVAEARRQSADLFSVFPLQRARGLGERLLVPLIDEVLLAFLPHRLLAMPVPQAATANGQLLAFWREAYDAIGGHASVRHAVVEDVRLAYTTRKAGLRLGLALGGPYVEARMYDGYAAAVRGFGKSVRAAHGGSRLLLTADVAWHGAAYTLPWLLGRRDRGWAVAAAAGPTQRLVVNAITGRGAPWEAALVPVTPLATLPVVAVALRRRAVWKGRVVG
jgi:hypothetical protein